MGYARPFRVEIVHVRGQDPSGKPIRCPATTLGPDIAHVHALQPGRIVDAECTACRARFPVSSFVWSGSSEVVGT